MILLVSFVMKNNDEEPLILPSDAVASEQPVADVVFVDIGGAVNNPMVVELDDGSRVEDAINAAGGLAEDADLTDINRAAFVNDGDKIYIPEINESSGQGELMSSAGGSTLQTDGRVNINTADMEQLQTITGVGPATAEKIIEYRNSNGRFTSVEDIKNVSGIGDKTFEKMKNSIRV